MNTESPRTRHMLQTPRLYKKNHRPIVQYNFQILPVDYSNRRFALINQRTVHAFFKVSTTTINIVGIGSKKVLKLKKYIAL